MATATLPKARKNLGIEGKKAEWMAEMTGKSMERWVELAKWTAKRVPPGAAILDVATGPGYLCIELAKLGDYAVSGLDLSHTLVEISKEKAAKDGVSVDFRQGDVCNMPFADNSFDFVHCRGAFKNFGDPLGALREMHRVLKPGCEGVIKDLNRNAPRKALNQTIDTWGLPLPNRLLTKLLFQFRVRNSAYSKEQFESMLVQVKFSRFEIQQNGIDIDVLMWKRLPLVPATFPCSLVLCLIVEGAIYDSF